MAREAAGVDGQPIYNGLEPYAGRAVLVANPQQIRGTPVGKTDRRTAGESRRGCASGGVEGSFIPTRPPRELRELVRYRKRLIRARTAEANRIQDVLEGAYIKLSSLLSMGWGGPGHAS